MFPSVFAAACLGVQRGTRRVACSSVRACLLQHVYQRVAKAGCRKAFFCMNCVRARCLTGSLTQVKEDKAERRKDKMPKHKKKFATKSHKAKIAGK